ncbi:hypothetical protein Plhal304r1_c008g0033811 [Plasmopara halstedii]
MRLHLLFASTGAIEQSSTYEADTNDSSVSEVLQTQVNTNTLLFKESKPIVSPSEQGLNASQVRNISEDDRRGNMYFIRSNEEERGVKAIAEFLIVDIVFLAILVCILL